MRENVTISYRGASYQIGRGEQFYGIWRAGATEPQPLEWWPVTTEGWSGAWSRFTALEAPGTIAPVAASQRPAAGLEAAELEASGRSTGAVVAVVLLAVGVVCGIAGLFPAYLSGVSLAKQPAEVVPHVIYFAAWITSAALIWLGGARQRVGALLATGISVVTFGFFFADAGQAIAAGLHVAGVGLWLGLIGWLACAAGSVTAFLLRPLGAPGKPRSDDMGPVVMLMLAAIGTAAAFAPSWDRYVLRIATGASATITAGNAFSNPGAVIAGNVLVMIAVVATVAAAALWRPIRLGAALLAGAIIPMAAEAISALVQVGEATSPQQFGYTQAQAAASGLTISSGVTAAFWIYCAFLVALIASFAWMLIPPHSAVPDGGRLQPGGPADTVAPTTPAGPQTPGEPQTPGGSQTPAGPQTPDPSVTAEPQTVAEPENPTAADAPASPPPPPAPEAAESEAADPDRSGTGTDTAAVAPIMGLVVPPTPSPGPATSGG